METCERRWVFLGPRNHINAPSALAGRVFGEEAGGGEGVVFTSEEAEALEPTDDGYHFVECPECNGSGKRKLNAEISYEKYLEYTPQDMPGLQYYVLRIPVGVTPPSEGQKLTLRGNPVVIQSVSTPEDIAKGKGGPVAKSMITNGIGWDVNCLPEGHEWLKR